MVKLKATRARGTEVALVANSRFGQGWLDIQRQQGNKPGDVTQLLRLWPVAFANVAANTEMEGS